MFVEELFARENIDCPQWLTKTFLEDVWRNSTHSIEDDIHTWRLQNPLQNLLITWDGKEYHFIAFYKNGEQMLDNIITEEWKLFC